MTSAERYGRRHKVTNIRYSYTDPCERISKIYFDYLGMNVESTNTTDTVYYDCPQPADFNLQVVADVKDGTTISDDCNIIVPEIRGK